MRMERTGLEPAALGQPHDRGRFHQRALDHFWRSGIRAAAHPANESTVQILVFVHVGIPGLESASSAALQRAHGVMEA